MVPKLTNNGMSLMIRAMNGEGITFTKIVIGSGEAPEDYTMLTKLQNELVSMDIAELVSEEKYVILKGQMTNANLDSGFYWTELGVYAENPDGGENILYAYAHYELSGDEAPTFIPAPNSNLVEITHSVHVFIGELDNVSAILLANSEYASAAALDAHLKDTNNPHNVTKNDVGLGLVENVLPADLKPAFSNAASAVTVDENGIISFSNIFNGERLGAILQKVRTVFSVILQHLHAKNPHNLTAETVGAAKEEHTHSATDINTGVLNVQRGGTGGSTTLEARRSLGIQSGRGTVTGVAGEAIYKSFDFSVAFASIPQVVVTPRSELSSTDVYISVSNITQTGFSVRIYSNTLNPIINFNWIAIQ